jgi:GDP-mannose 6-dehydrogenase
MKISIFGMGYVGCVSSACIADTGHEVIGVDVSSNKVKMINNGKSPIIEKDLPLLIEKSVSKKRLSATTDYKNAVRNTDLSLICVGTPSNTNGSLDLRYVIRVCENIGSVLKDKDAFHVIVIRSTVLPGTLEDILIPTLEKTSGKKCKKDFGVCFNPEFLREGTAVSDFFNPPKTVIGASDVMSAKKVEALYGKLSAPVFQTSIKVAEMVKYSDNTFHAVKVCFANEIGNICKRLGIDSHKVMEIFCEDTKLNLSPYYLKPGFAFGGSCLPKDIRALGYKAKELDLLTPLLSSLLPSNEIQLKTGIQKVLDTGKKKVGFLGFSFKAGTDDLRESPIVEMIETLLGKGYSIRIFDRNVSLARLMGANKEYIEKHIPHIASLMSDDMDEVIRASEVIVIGNKSEEFRKALKQIPKEQLIIDLVRISDEIPPSENYDGICW